MQAVIEPNDPTLSQAMDALANMESTEVPANDGNANVDQPDAGAGDPNAGSDDNDPSKTDDGAPLDADKQPDKTKDESPKTDDKSTSKKTGEKPRDDEGKFTKDGKPVDDANKSKFAKNAERRDNSWKALNEEKENHRKLVDAEKIQLERRKQELDAREQKLQQQAQPRHKPEDFETQSMRLENQALKLRAEAKAAEDAGDDAKATALHKQADRADYDAEKNKEYAKYLRDNPAPTDEQQQARLKEEEKKWYTKAGQEFPATAKEGTPEREALKGMIKAVPSLLQSPEQMYYACRLVSAETAANRVPTLTKELDQAKAKIAELEKQLSIPTEDTPGNGGGATDVPLDKKPFEEGFSDLAKEAAAMGAFN